MRGCSTLECKRGVIGDLVCRRRMDVCALSETKLKGRGVVKFGDVLGRVSGVRSGRAREGVALLLSDRVNERVIEWKEVSSRLMWVKVKWGCEMWVFVSAYGPGTERSVEERHEFWNDLSDCIASFNVRYHIVVLGDLNARVGDLMIDKVLGRYGVPGLNESGERMIEMCMEQELAIGNSMFKKKDIKKFTWTRVVGGRVVERALMDYVLVKWDDICRLLDVEVFRGEARGISDHYLVEAKLRVRGGWWKKGEKVKGREEVRTYELRKSDRQAEYQEKIRLDFDKVCERPAVSVEEEWHCLKDAVKRNALEVCGTRRVGRGLRKGSEWWNEEVKLAVSEKKRAYEVWLQSGSLEDYECYKGRRKMVKRVVKNAKKVTNEKWERKLTENFEENKKMFWKEVKKLRKSELESEERVKDRNGRVLVESRDVSKRWAEYFGELLNVVDEREAVVVPVGDGSRMPVFGGENDRLVSREEVNVAIKDMKEGKAAGLDGCAVEHVKRGGEAVIGWLVRLFNLCFVYGLIPERRLA